MYLETFKRCTNRLDIPQDIYQTHGEPVAACPQKHAPAPSRSEVTGTRATSLGDFEAVEAATNY
eukprot:12922369-Prorocentrum_lima.AAC.1